MFKYWKHRAPSPPHLVRERADAARDARDWRLAAVLYEIHLENSADADDASLWVQLGNCRKEAGEYDGALQAYRRSLELDPERSDTHLQTGHLHKVAGRPDHASASYAVALRLDPRCADAREELLALRHLVEAAQADASAPASDILGEADAARDAGRWAEAAAAYAAYLETEPAEPDAQAAYVQLGHARKEAGDLDGAVLAYEAALDLEPADAETYMHLGHLHKAMGANGAALEALTAASRLAPHLDGVGQGLRDLAAAEPTPAVRRSPATTQGDIRYAFPLPWTGDRRPFVSPFPPIHAGLNRSFGDRDAGPR